jgi:tape measure domain-containing protein
MATIDERVVNMQFNNKQFENGVKTTLNTLDSLKNSLEFKDDTGGIMNLVRAFKQFSLDTISNNIDSLSQKFSVLSIIGTTAIVNLSNSAVNMGRRITSALTIDPVKTGLEEYETKMNAITTILTNTASKGTDIKQVNDALDELNIYADKTIYNFAQMTDNIGKFTAAGLGLNDAVTVIKGMSNVAAGFGVDATKMAGATYQMSQALSAGRVQLMDWKSMEMASMGGELLQNSLRETAKEMGITVDATKSFRNTLESGWLTTEVFVKTMEKMANDNQILIIIFHSHL